MAKLLVMLLSKLARCQSQLRGSRSLRAGWSVWGMGLLIGKVLAFWIIMGPMLLSPRDFYQAVSEALGIFYGRKFSGGVT